MASLLRVRARWGGFPGAPGYSVMHFRNFAAGGDPAGGYTTADATAAAGRVRTFFNALTNALPGVVTIDVLREVDVIEDTTGDLVTSLTAGVQAQVVGGRPGPFSAASGAVINWRTAGVRNGKRLRGRTFLVPISSDNMANDGTVSPGAVTYIQNAALALADSAGSPDLMVYGRPTSAQATNGVASVVNGVTVPSLAAVLRSRRD